MPETLRLCPVCGKEVRPFQEAYPPKLWRCGCINCGYGLNIGYKTLRFSDRESAIAAWNNYPALPEIRPCPFCGGKAKLYSTYGNGRTMWRITCGASVACCSLVNEWDSPEEAITAWNRRTITERELESALESLRRRKAKNAESTQEFLGDTEPNSGASGTADNVSSAGLPCIAGGSASAGVEGDTRNDERRPR